MVALFCVFGLFQTGADVERARAAWAASDRIVEAMADHAWLRSLRDPFARPDQVATSGPAVCRPSGAEPLRLIALITGTPVPKAMVVGADGKGRVLREGQLFGKRIHRVQHIRSNEVVLEAVELHQDCPRTRTLRLDPNES